MAGLSQSHFLQSLGWATLNSFWQMAVIWCIYLSLSYFLKLNSARKYQLSVLSVMSGFAWYFINLIIYLNSPQVSGFSFFNQTVTQSNNLLHILLISASLAYLILLFFPAFRLVRNWLYVLKIKNTGLAKASMHCRLFVQKTAAQINIRKKVLIYVSELVKSPVTVGYFKPIILLPVAAMNNLSVSQTEAILLHELAHIKRYDYLINLIVSLAGTVLYFNPFVKFFIRNIEEERENCCDELVLLYGYDKVSYASALLTLEKSVQLHQPILAIGAAGKGFLLNRIEKITGMEKKSGTKHKNFTGILTALCCIVLFNSILIIQDKRKSVPSIDLAYNIVSHPFHLFESDDSQSSPVQFEVVPAQKAKQQRTFTLILKPQNKLKIEKSSSEITVPVPVDAANDNGTDATVLNVGFDEVDGSLSEDQKQQVKSTVEATRKVINDMQWETVENKIADAMNEQEKMKAKKELNSALNKTINWENVEKGLKSQYDKVNWDKINYNISQALSTIKLDSIQKVYSNMLVQLDKARAEINLKNTTSANPLPDVSVDVLNKSCVELKSQLNLLKAMKAKKVIRL